MTTSKISSLASSRSTARLVVVGLSLLGALLAPSGQAHAGYNNGTTCANVIQSVTYAGANGDLGNAGMWTGGVAPGANDVAYMPNVANVTWSGTGDLCGISGNHMNLTLNDTLEVEELWFREGALHDNGHDLVVTGTLSDRVHNWIYEFNGSSHSPTGGNKYVNNYEIGRGAGWFIWAPGDFISGDILTFRVRNVWPDMTITQVTGYGYDLSAGLTLDEPDATIGLGYTSPSDMSEMVLNWDTGAITGDIDWTLRWQGEHVAELMQMYDNGQLVIGTLPSDILAFDPALDIFYAPDGYTYIGFRSFRNVCG